MYRHRQIPWIGSSDRNNPDYRKECASAIWKKRDKSGEKAQIGKKKAHRQTKERWAPETLWMVARYKSHSWTDRNMIKRFRSSGIQEKKRAAAIVIKMLFIRRERFNNKAAC
ncbi:hypothetical protein [Oceanospirillum multiglobuliferum]|uniref:Uncharacterized protein n=1 Tax=Oceanospirillum multiglobuliferum TaxID=64969 RepID=A0A1V4T1L5_9GAMM|nr:hypothetical protein [Oceanospirillum multiglobuliferum]OPX54416.1 hypothetical protein BTE48_14390 [Oceanospirillum multiglobuliferum]